MAPETRNRGKAPPPPALPASKIYRRSPPPPRQKKFPARATTVKKTYTRKSLSTLRELDQSTLTQFGYGTPVHPDDMIEDDVLIGGEELEMARPNKRRRTMGDVPNPTAGSTFHTQTLTQFYSDRAGQDDDEEEEGGVVVIQDSDEEEEESVNDHGVEYDMEGDTMVEKENTSPNKKTKRAASISPLKKTNRAASIVPRTPKKRVRTTEIPDSQSPATPWQPTTPGMNRLYEGSNPSLENFRSPLREQSTNTDAPPPTTESLSKVRPRRRLEIADSYSTVSGGGSSPVKPRTPFKELRTMDPDMSLDLALSGGGGGGDEEDSRMENVTPSQESKQSTRLASDVILDSADEFGETPRKEGGAGSDGFPTPLPKSVVQQSAERVKDEDGDIIPPTPSARGAATQASRSATQRSSTLQPLDESEEEEAEKTPSARVPATQTSKSTSQRRATREPLVEIIDSESEQTPSARVPATQNSRTGSPRRTTPEAESDDEGFEPETPSQRPSHGHSQGAAERVPSTQLSDRAPRRKASPEPEYDVEEIEPETPNPSSQRRPSVSSAVEVEKDTPLSSPQKTSPAQEPQTQAQTQFGKSQWSSQLESQRVPLEIIRNMGPQTDRSDIIISVHPEHVEKIVDGTKNHEFRSYRIPPTVSRIWIYVTQPLCHLKYMAIISNAKEAGEIEDESGVGNAEFNRGQDAKFAYELKQVYQLNNPVPIKLMKENGWVNQPPQKYAYVPPTVLGELLGNLRCALFDEPHTQASGIGISVSQEVEMQLRAELAHSTQLQPASSQGHDAVVIPSSQDEDLGTTTHKATLPRSSNKNNGFAKPSMPPPRSQAAATMTQHSPSSTTLRRSQRTVRPSQATTVSAPSSPSPRATQYTQTQTTQTQPVRPQDCSSDDLPSFPDDIIVGDSPMALAKSQFSIGQAGSSQAFLLHDSLVDDDAVRQPPAVVWDSDGDDDI